MKSLFTEFKRQVLEIHEEVALNVLQFKYLFDFRAVFPLVISTFLALKFSDLLLFSGIIFFLLDYLTGTLATRIEYKKNPEKLQLAQLRKGKMYWFESERIVRGTVKFSVYSIVLISSIVLTYLLKEKQFQLHESVLPLTPYEIALILINVSEIVSNLENSKRAGFDLIGGVEKTIKKVWNIRNLIKTGKDESSN